MEMHRKKKVEIVVEAVRLTEMLRMIESVGGRGYTVIPEVSGKGNCGLRDEAHVSDVFRNVMIVVVTSEEVARRIVEESQVLLVDYAGVVFVSEVEVLRAEHF